MNKQVRAEESEGNWAPFESVHALRGLEGFTPLVRNVTSARWVLRYPLQQRIVAGYTVGEIFVLLPAAVLLLVLGVLKFLEGDLEDSGSLATIPFAIAFGLVMKNSVVTFLAGIPFERQIMYHRYTAYIAITLGLLHGLAYHLDMDEGGSDDHDDDRRLLGAIGIRRMLDDDDEDQVVTGWIAQGAAFGLLLSSLWFVRRNFFNFFIVSHFVCFLTVIGGLVFHGAALVLIGVALWGVDLAYRAYASAYLHTQKAHFESKPGGVIKVTIADKTFAYKGGQYIFLLVPGVSMWEWHPFSLSSSPNDTSKNLTLHIKVLGDWTKALQKLILAKGGQVSLSIGMDGPYGEPFINLDSARYRSVLAFSGGIGITPMLSITRELGEQQARGRPLSLLRSVWAVRDSELIRSVLEGKELPTCLNFDVYLTNGKAGDLETAVNVQEGRPDLADIFRQTFEHAKAAKETRVAVLVCGPKKLVDSVIAHASRASKSSVTFDVHWETFEF